MRKNTDIIDNNVVRAYPPASAPPGPALWLLLREGTLLVRENDEGVSLIEKQGDPRGSHALTTPLYLGTLEGRPCWTDDLNLESSFLEGTQLVPLRSLFGALPEPEYLLAGYASQMLHWRRTSGFCSVCGHATVAREGDWGRRCPSCGHIAYPQISPAVLILIYDDAGRILLGHKPGWGARYSILAGFAEPGESLEDCVRREVREEVDVSVTDLVYAGSQPWPYPNQLMIGFTARYVHGEVHADAEELDDARWFTADALPELPSPVSLSRQMIESWRNNSR